MSAENSDPLLTAYNSSERCSPCPDDDAIRMEEFRVSFAIPVLITQKQNGRLVELIADIIDSPWNQPLEGVHWPSGFGSLPKWSQVAQMVLGLKIDPKAPPTGDPSYDDTVYQIETCAREFVSEKERDRKLISRAKKVRREEKTTRKFDMAVDALKAAYRKHVKGDESIGWNELGTTLQNTLCELIGDKVFQEWNKAGDEL